MLAEFNASTGSLSLSAVQAMQERADARVFGTLSDDSPYLKDVNIPEYTGAVGQFVIETESDWSHINDTDKFDFYVRPNNYMYMGNIEITESGSQTKRKTLSLLSDDDNDLHPVQLADNERMMFSLFLNGASYWTIDRMTMQSMSAWLTHLKNGASFNIFNRMLATDVSSSFTIKNYCHNNTVQNSRFEHQRDIGADGPVAMQLYQYDVEYLEVFNTHCINNEFYNCNDGFMIVRTNAPVGYPTAYYDINAEGTVIDNCSFTKDVVNMENAIDLKGGSENPDNPVIISNNHIWGYRKHPDYVPIGYVPGDTGLVAHYSPPNVHLIDNIFHDCDVGFGTGSNGPTSGFDKGLLDSLISGNLFYNCGSDERHIEGITMSATRRTVMENNVILNGQWGYGAFENNSDESYFRYNDISNTPNAYVLSGNDVDFTTSFNNDNTHDAVEYTEDYSYTWNKFSASPQTITIPNCRQASTVESPYLRTFVIPDYDASDPSHCIIGADGEPWTANVLNGVVNSEWRHFYVQRGFYAGRPTITRSGASNDPITISPYDSTVHPAQLTDVNRAMIALEFDAVSYIIVSRMCSNKETLYGSYGNIFFNRDSKNIIIDQMYFGAGFLPIGIRKRCEDNTIQKCFFDDILSRYYKDDGSFIQLIDTQEVENEYAPTLRTRIIANDFKNYKAIRLQAQQSIRWAKDYSGTIVDGNVLWYDEDTRCTSDGTPDPDGLYARNEQGFGGIKTASNDINSPVIYSNNVVMHSRPTWLDPTDTLSSNNPALVLAYYYTKYLKVRGNISYDCPAGFTSTYNGSPTDRNYDVLIEHNRTVNTGFNDVNGWNDDNCVPIRMEATNKGVVRNNVFINPALAWANISTNNGTVGDNACFVGNNTIVNKALDAITTPDQATMDGLKPVDTNTYLSTAEGAINFPYNYTITYGRYTTTPQTRVLENVLEMPQADFVDYIHSLNEL